MCFMHTTTPAWTAGFSQGLEHATFRTAYSHEDLDPDSNPQLTLHAGYKLPLYALHYQHVFE